MLFLLSIITLFAILNTSAQNVGIGTGTPNASGLLHLDLGSNVTKGLLVTGNFSYFNSTLPDLGVGSRMMFYPGKAAFRVGYVEGTEWNNSNVGLKSIAMGYGTIAFGEYSTALGFKSTASGSVSTVMGASNVASGNYSTAMGYNSTASGDFSIAIGYSATANAVQSIALGTDVSTNGKTGSMILGDGGDGYPAHVFTSEADNQLFSRFKGGYKFYTSGWGTVLGVVLAPGGNAWSSFSDERMKENFETLDSEEVLKKLSAVKYTSWNYKRQDPKTYRHYGIMAQDFFNAFGKDRYGIIGNDTMVNPIDMMGIAYSAIQALEKRTQAFKEENLELKNEVSLLNSRLEKLEKLCNNISVSSSLKTINNQ